MDWWTEEDGKEYEARVEVMVEQANKFEVHGQAVKVRYYSSFLSLRQPFTDSCLSALTSGEADIRREHCRFRLVPHNYFE